MTILTSPCPKLSTCQSYFFFYFKLINDKNHHQFHISHRDVLRKEELWKLSWFKYQGNLSSSSLGASIYQLIISFIWSYRICYNFCVCACTQLHPTLCDPMDYSPPGSSVHGNFRAGILELVGISFSKRSSWPRDRTHISCSSCISRRILYYCHLGSPMR